MKQSREISLFDFLEDGFYSIPDFQRSYSWEEEQLEDLWNDIKYLPKGKNHFFGNVVIQDTGEKKKGEGLKELSCYDVIDGQQRIVTTIIFLVVAKNYTERELGMERVIWPAGEERLKLLDQDQDYFQTSILGANPYPDFDTPSQERLKRAKDYFEEKIKGNQDDLKDFLGRFLNNFKLNQIVIEDEEEEAAMFETINDRGKQLTSLEKTKSFLMHLSSLVSQSDTSPISPVRKIKKEFGEIYKKLFVLSELARGHRNAQNFSEDHVQRYHWGVYRGYDKDKYYNPDKTFKKELRGKYQAGEFEEVLKECINYAGDLRQASSAFNEIFRPREQGGQVKASLLKLIELNRLATVLPLLITSFLRLKDCESELKEMIEQIETLVLRVYIVDGRRSDTGLNRLVSLAHSFYREEKSCAEVKNELKEITRHFAADDRLERDLLDNNLYRSLSSREIKYLLFHYEMKLRDKLNEKIDLDISDVLTPKYEVEHILAQSLPEKERPASLKNQDKFDNLKHSLGNLTLATKGWNAYFGNASFLIKKSGKKEDNKKKCYSNSGLSVQRSLAGYEDFGEDEINERTKKLVGFVLKHWSI